MKINSVKLLSRSIWFLLLTSFVVSVNVYAETYKASSSSHPVGLVELYTSQGCSSCPPADKWLGNLESLGITSKQVVPLALHVDYWDYIGWKDQFAQKYFTERQYQYRKNNHSSSVYTPQIMFNGEDIRRVRFDNSLGKLSKQKAAVAFDVEVNTLDGNKLNVNIDFKRIDQMAKGSRLILVLSENMLVGKIKAGENSGKTLQHHHVARVWKNLGRLQNKMSAKLAINKEWQRKNLELVLFVETPDMQTLQALQLALK